MTPMKYRLRAAWFQVHKWLGLVLAILIVPIALSGSALVWHDALDELVNPSRYAISAVPDGAPDRLEFSRYAAAAAPVLTPGERISGIRLPEHEATGPVLVTVARPPSAEPGTRPVRTLVWLDPATAAVLDHSDSASGVVRTLHVLHGSLLVPGVGRQIVGWIGVALLVSSVSGLWLWWPFRESWYRGLRWRRHRHVDGRLHHLVGFWVMVPLAVLSATGVWISFPQAFSRFATADAARPPPNAAARFRAQPLATPIQTIDGVVTRAVTEVEGRPYVVTWPTDQRAEWTVSVQRDAASSPVEVSVDDATGRARVREQGGGGGLARTMRELHDGSGYGLGWQSIIFAAGVLPALLAVTGIIMWWRVRRRRKVAQ